MKNSVTPQMAEHLAEEVTTIAYLWRVIRVDGEIFCFTSHDEDISFNSETYEASSGFMPSAALTSSGLAVDDVELEGMLSSDSITPKDLIAGLWDGAEVWLFMVNYKDLSQGAIIVRRGWTGEVRSGKMSFQTELRGVSQKLAQQIGENYSPTCRANFCDDKCKLLIANYQVTGTITSVLTRHSFLDSGRGEASGYFDLGRIEFTSGLNIGLAREVKTFASSTINCELPFPYDVQIGDQYSISRGCNKLLATCRDTYNNIINFRGEPYIPVIDSLVQGPN